jgi:hypothetical protein
VYINLGIEIEEQGAQGIGDQRVIVNQQDFHGLPILELGRPGALAVPRP